MNIPILKTLKKIPGGMMVVPLLLGVIINSTFPQALEIGGFSTALFKSGINAFVALFFVCSGAQIQLNQAARPIAKGTVLLISKFVIGAAIGLGVGHVFGMGGVLGLTPLALISAITNSSGTLYVALASEYGDSSDVGAIGPLCLNDSPFLTMLVFGVAGMADIPFMALFAAILPLFIGIILGNIDKEMKDFLAPGTSMIVPFVAFCLGANLRFQSVLSAGLSGVLLGIITVVATGLGGYISMAIFNHGKPKAVGAAIGSCAGICSATPLYIAQIDPSLMPFVENALASCTSATIVTAILCPFFVAFLDRLDKKRESKTVVVAENTVA